MEDEPAEIALTVLRLCLSPDGLLRRRATTGIAVRAGLFAGLILTGRLTGLRWPLVLEADTEDGLTRSILRAVDSQGPVMWKRWFSHTEADTAAAEAELIAHRIWTPAAQDPANATSAAGRRRSAQVADVSPGLVTAQAAQILRLMATSRDLPTSSAAGQDTTAGRAAAASADLVVSLLATGAGLLGGRPRPRAALRQLNVLLPKQQTGLDPQQAQQQASLRAAVKAALTQTGLDPQQAQQQASLRAAVKAALTAMRRRAGLSWLTS